jgi:pyruvate/2-oxoglutarate/acetoin dehydrogenase E1 component
MPVISYLEAIRQALFDEMQRDARVFVMGEDIGAYGGAFKVTDGLLDRFGAARVIDAPISEQAIVGSAIGASYTGMRPVCEIQFIDFIACCFDMLTNFAATSRYRNGAGVPIVVRGPCGGGVGGGPFHSLNPEAFFLNTPGLKMVEPSTAYDAKGLLKAAIRDDDPVIFMEGELLYNVKGEVPDEPDFVIPLGVAELKRAGSDVSIITHGKMINVALQAASKLDKDGIQADVLDLRTIRPLDMDAILTTVAKTNRVVYLEEGWPYAGTGAQVVSMIQEEAFDELDAPVLRVSQADIPMPYAKNLENLAKPSADRVVAACNKVLYR